MKKGTYLVIPYLLRKLKFEKKLENPIQKTSDNSHRKKTELYIKLVLKSKPWWEGPVKKGLSILVSFCLSRNFFVAYALAFPDIWHGVRDPCGVVRGKVESFRKNSFKNDQK